eukprot:3359874-Pleurochrysis_carterae.AAC.2
MNVRRFCLRALETRKIASQNDNTPCKMSSSNHSRSTFLKMSSAQVPSSATQQREQCALCITARRRQTRLLVEH